MGLLREIFRIKPTPTSHAKDTARTMMTSFLVLLEKAKSDHEDRIVMGEIAIRTLELRPLWTKVGPETFRDISGKKIVINTEKDSLRAVIEKIIPIETEYLFREDPRPLEDKIKEANEALRKFFKK